jgi:hypothetical protein
MRSPCSRAREQSADPGVVLGIVHVEPALHRQHAGAAAQQAHALLRLYEQALPEIDLPAGELGHLGGQAENRGLDFGRALAGLRCKARHFPLGDVAGRDENRDAVAAIVPQR